MYKSGIYNLTAVPLLNTQTQLGDPCIGISGGGCIGTPSGGGTEEEQGMVAADAFWHLPWPQVT